MEKDDDDNDETAGKARFPVLPSLISLQQMRNRLNTAQSGRRLMQWSALATGAELRRIAKELGIVYVSFTEQVRDAFIILARCRYFYPNLNKMVLENFPKKACVTVGRNTKSIAGCRIATYGIEDNCPDSYPFLGIDKGGEVIAEAKQTWHELLRKMIFIEQLRSNFMSLDLSHDQTNKKAKVLGKIIIPRTMVTIRYILSELEELEREEFFRLKKVLEVKYRLKKKAKARAKDAEKKEMEEKEYPRVGKASLKATACVACGGPFHPGQPLTDQAAISEIKDNIDKLLSATENYEKTVSQGEDLNDFKRTAKELKNILRTPPSSIPDDVDVENLCDLCKEIYYEQLPKCVTCDEPIIPTKSFEKTVSQGDTLIHFKQTTAILKNKLRKQPASIPDNVNIEDLCDLCKDVYYRQQRCTLCGGPLDRTDDTLRVAAKESRRLLLEQLETLLTTIKQYESEGRQGDELKEFKENAADLKKKLEGSPMDMDKLCSDCIERMAKPERPLPKIPSTCAVCHGPITGMDEKLRVATKESRRQLLEQLEALLGVTKQYESEGREGNELKEFKQTAAELKKKLQGPPIPHDVDITALCPDCKDRMSDLGYPMTKVPITPGSVSIKASKVSIKSPPKSGSKAAFSTGTSMASSEMSSDLQLGVFETEEITEIIQVKNPDGTVSEKRRVITIKRKPKDDDKASGSGTSSFKDRKVGLVSVIHDRKGLTKRLPGDAQSEYVIRPLPMVDPMVKSSLSSSCRFDEVLQGFTELSLRDNSNGSEIDNFVERISNDFSITHSRKEDKTDEKEENDSSIDSEMPEN
ncbi:uncharacterized protein LOC133531942 [Cydia pomonella]|uniref:uncharacterized protein LOC133531942 n=1 Tax=Cydia pomonella TaxID=82600 RepID=UPI002ADE4830|nr:uncharacterized protein LOC133531942 [Cydia pomonella]